MAESNVSVVTAAAEKKASAFRAYEEKFTQSPDPWTEIATLESGGDRTFASTVQRMVTSAEPGQRAAMETKLLATLAQPALTAVGRMFVARMLAWIGTDRSVPALTALLGDERTADVARYALEAIPGEASSAALVAALDRLSGRAKTGLIGGIALRDVTAAVPALERIATDARESVEIRAAAARAVARLQTSTRSS